MTAGAEVSQADRQEPTEAVRQVLGKPRHFRRVKFLSRLFTALNLLPSMATLAAARRPISRQSSTKRAHTLPSASPLSLRKSACLVIRCEPTQQPH